MTSLRCFVVDDEPLAVKMLENFIARTPFLELVASFTDPVLALSEMRTQAPDLVFLDIQMPDLSGMELSRMVPAGTRISKLNGQIRIPRSQELVDTLISQADAVIAGKVQGRWTRSG